MLAAVLASGPTNLNFIPTDGGFLDLLFHQTKLTFEIFGWPRPPFQYQSHPAHHRALFGLCHQRRHRAAHRS